MKQGLCALCKKQGDLRNSHVIPSFVGKWLKATSATPFLRSAANPSERIQDLQTYPLLCGDCEQYFSRLEKYFASKIFYPFIEGQRNISYDENLLYFVVSLSWRSLKTTYDDERISQTPWIKKYVDEAEEKWRRLLLEKSTEECVYEHHVFFLDSMQISSETENFQWYTLRATDYALAGNVADVVYSYSHIPMVFFVSSIFPIHLSGWDDVKIEWQGTTAKSFKLNTEDFWDFIMSRCNAGSGLENTNSDNIVQSIRKNPARFLNSESFKLLLAEFKKKRKENAKTLPKGIAELIYIIDCSLDDPNLSSLDQKAMAYSKSIIAEELSNLPKDKADEISAKLYAVYKAAYTTGLDINFSFETDGIIGKYIVCFVATKKEQQKLVKDSLEQLKSRTNSKNIVVFSFNPLDMSMPYETAYYYKSLI